MSAAEHSVYSGIVYRCSISACKVEGFNGGCVYIYIYISVSIYTHTLFFLKSGAGFLAICCILELKYPIYMPTWLLAFGFWLLAVGFARLLVFVGFWFLSSGG